MSTDLLVDIESMSIPRRFRSAVELLQHAKKSLEQAADLFEYGNPTVAREVAAGAERDIKTALLLAVLTEASP